MAEDDIYHNKSRYEKFIANLDGLTKAPKPSTATGRGIRKYYCKNPVNLIYFRNLDKHFQLKDNSYIRRLRLMRVFQIAVFVTEKELSQVTREDINEIVTFSHSVNLSPKSKADFIRDIRYIWQISFLTLSLSLLKRNSDYILPWGLNILLILVLLALKEFYCPLKELYSDA